MSLYATESEISVEEHSPVTKKANGQSMRFSAFFATKDDELLDDDDSSPWPREKINMVEEVLGGPLRTELC
jgi:hypothetical protein